MRERFWSASCAILGGSIWLLAPLVLSTYQFSQTIRYDILILIAPLFLVIGLVGYYREYTPAYSSAGRVKVWLLGVGVLGFVPLATHKTLFTFTLPVGVVLFGIAILGAVLVQAGTIGIAIDTWRTEVPSRWIAVWLPLALPATAVSNYVGATTLGLFRAGTNYYTGIFGLAWIGLGYHLWRSNETTHSWETDE